MDYEKIIEGTFLRRPNRFIAIVLVDGQEETVHVKNTGRCKELLLPGSRVLLEKSNNPNRKTNYSLVAVYKGKKLINMDSQIPNAAAAKALQRGILTEIGIPDFIKREVTYSKSRFDLYYEKDGQKGFIEVKGVTLEQDGNACFPDAPTSRGEKHIRELIKAKNDGYEAAILFVIQMSGMKSFHPNMDTDLPFAKALKEAEDAGVRILAYECHVTKHSMEITKKIPVFLPEC